MLEAKENIVRTVGKIRNIVGTAGLVFAAYVLINTLPDVKRYLRIVWM
jgi:hypothetical protein